jgi:hypothetical protein
MIGLGSFGLKFGRFGRKYVGEEVDGKGVLNLIISQASIRFNPSRVSILDPNRLDSLEE